MREKIARGHTSDTVSRSLVYDGLTIELVIPKTAPDNFLIQRVDVTSPAWQVTRWVRVGDDISRVLEKLGRNLSTHGQKLEISGDTDSVTLNLARNRVKRIVYRCYSG